MTDTEKLVACHRSKVSAQRQITALLASQVKGEDMDETPEVLEGADEVQTEPAEGVEEKQVVAYVDEALPYVPSTVTTLAELDKVRVADDAARDMRLLADDFKAIMNNILWQSEAEVGDKATAIEKLTEEFATYLREEAAEIGTKDKATWSRKFINDLPDSAFLFIESGGEKNGNDKTVPRSLRHFPYKDSSGAIDLPHLRNAIGRIPQSNAEGLTAEKKRKLQDKARGILSREQEKEVTLLNRITEAAKDWYAEAFGKDTEPAEKSEPGENTLMLWKQEDSRYRWLAVFSNKYRDDDRPPEILSEAAHKEFARAVKDGDWPYPELRHWHMPGTRWGISDWIDYDDGIGFILASGLVDEGHEVEADAMVNIGKEIRISHGMPRKEIKRDAEDKTIITRYRTAEISDLPGWAAANPLTGFNIFGQEVKTMRDEIKEYLQEVGMTSERIAELETELEGTAKQATEEREFKGAEPKPDVQQDEPEPESDAEKDAVLTKEEIAEAIVTSTAKAIQPLVDNVEALGKRLEDLERSDEEKVTEKAEATPAASLADLIHARTVGSKEARVDGRTSLAKDGPDETELPAEVPHMSGIPWIDQMVATKPEQGVQ